MTPDDPVQMVLEAAARRRRRPPLLRPMFAGAVVAIVGAFVLSPGLRNDANGLFRQSQTVLTDLAPEEGPTGAAAVSAEAYAPERAATAGRGGANVRDYPLLSGDLIANVPARTPLNINGRLMVQGVWWFRIVLEDGTVGFVREDVVAWGARTSVAAAPERYTVDPVEPALAAVAGRAGARIRTAPSLNARQLVRLEAAAPVTVTGRLRQGSHWWLRVQLEDGQSGFARDDVLRAPGGGALDLPA